MLVREGVRGIVLLVLLVPGAVDAAQRTFVSAGSGSDANPCSRALPCRGFAAAIAQTDPAGEVVVLDTGGYGPLTISQSVALIAPPGVHAAITLFSPNSVEIAAASTDVVVLRGLYINGLGASYGITFSSGRTLHVENSVVSGFSYAGIYGAAENAEVYVTDTTLRQNYNGILVGATVTRASLAAVLAEDNEFAVAAGSYALVTVTRSVASGNAVGFYGLGGVINVESCTVSTNDWGVYVSSGTIRVRNSMISGNETGVHADLGGTTISFGNNGLDGNVTDGSFTTTIAQQ